jgi:hypothetical protein
MAKEGAVGVAAARRLQNSELDRVGFVLLENLAPPLEQHLDQRIEARPQSGDLAGIESHGPSQLLLGQLTHVAVSEPMVQRGRDDIGRRSRRAGKLERIVFW